MNKDIPKQKSRKAAVQAERFKMLAGGTQLIAVGVLGASVIAPIFNNAQRFSLLLAGCGGLTAGVLEMVAWALMGYAVPPAVIEQENADA